MKQHQRDFREMCITLHEIYAINNKTRIENENNIAWQTKNHTQLDKFSDYIKNFIRN